MNESAKFSKTLSDIDEDDSTSVSVTIYEDESDLNYFNKSLSKPAQLPSLKEASDPKQRVLTASSSKRSPLSLINKNNQAGPSSSNQLQQVKAPFKIDINLLRAPEPRIPLPDPFNHLSDEVLLMVFAFLPKKALARAAQVNQRFSRVTQDETLWCQLDLASRCVRARALGTILNRGVLILRLAQAKIVSPIFGADFSAEDASSRLAYLDLSMASIDTESLRELLSACRFLVKLSLEAVPINDSICRKIAANRSIEVLNLAMCEGLTTVGIRFMLPRLQSLTALNLSWTQIETGTVHAVVTQIHPSIVRLNMSGCRQTLIDKRKKMLSVK